jgi:O-antigen/teichoic acid export membrane protein
MHLAQHTVQVPPVAVLRAASAPSTLLLQASKNLRACVCASVLHLVVVVVCIWWGGWGWGGIAGADLANASLLVKCAFAAY